MAKYLLTTGLLLFCSYAASTAANEQATPMHWERDSAMAAVQSVRVDVAVSEIGDISSLNDGGATVSNLEYLASRADWPLPAREAAIHQFARSLAKLPRRAVADEVMQYLQNYQPLTLVPHEEHRESYIPLFNIRGAAQGVENGWQRLDYSAEAAKLLETDPAALVGNYARLSNPNQRSGYLDALRDAPMADVVDVQLAAIGKIGSMPEITAVLATTAEITSDAFAIRQLLTLGDGAGLSPALRQIDTRLDVSETAALLGFAIDEAPPANAALAIAAWWPRLRHDPATRELMVGTLADPELGSSAALALAQAPDIQTIRMLQQTALGDSASAKRAQMALDLNRDQLSGEHRQ